MNPPDCPSGVAVSILLLLLPFQSILAAEKPPARQRGPDVLVVADAAGPAGALRPAAGSPVYYRLIGGVERSLGEKLVDLRLPDESAVRGELVKALATQGFVATEPGGPPPRIAILFSWGTARLMWEENDPERPVTDFDGGLKSYPAGLGPGNADDPAIINRREIVQLLGIDKTDRRLLPWWDVDKLNGAYRGDRIYIDVAALDLDAAAAKQRKLLWRTRISIDWRDHTPDALRVMFASAAPHFGLAVSKPLFIDDALRRKAQIEIGEMRVITTEAEPKAGAGDPPPREKSR